MDTDDSTAGTGFRVRLVDWREHSAALGAIRTRVFVMEQNVPADLELDGLDGDCVHVLAETDEGLPVGTGRLMPDGRIGRMAVLPAWRNRGVGAAMLAALMQEAKRKGFSVTYLHAQIHAKAFYLRHGFIPRGEEYLEAGIPHIEMTASL